ncbi:MAG: metallophosphoesterase, partial [Tagaea sp.]|nr:metallophosphoesterase [Tagaea sp.]
MLIAQFTDTHVMVEGRLAYKRFDTYAMLARAIDAICALDPVPDLALATGDLVDRGSPEEYARLKTQLDRLPMKLALIPGNHDVRGPMAAAFAKSAIVGEGEFLHWVRDDLGPVRVIGLDSLSPGQVGGSLCDKRIAWLDATLAAAPDRPTFVALHHPPFPTGIAHIERFAFSGADAL